MKLNYEAEWELEDEVIDNIVNEVVNTLEQHPDCDVDDCISEITADNLSEMDCDECDQFNLELYFNKVTEEVKKRYLDHKPKIEKLVNDNERYSFETFFNTKFEEYINNGECNPTFNVSVDD